MQVTEKEGNLLQLESLGLLELGVKFCRLIKLDDLDQMTNYMTDYMFRIYINIFSNSSRNNL